MTVMYNLAASASAAVYKRAVDVGEGVPEATSPTLFLILIANFLVFLPVFVYCNYTLGHLFPVLVIVEDPDSPAYEPVSLGGDSRVQDGSADPASAADNGSSGRAVSSSLRGLSRLLYSVGGWRASFRGIWAKLFCGFVASFVGRILWVPNIVVLILVNLALVQFSAAWVHIVMSPPNPAPFWRRLPPYGKALKATWAPVVIHAIALYTSTIVPEVVAAVLRLPGGSIPDFSRVDRHTTWKSLIVLLVMFVLWAFVLMPATVLLVRVQASLLPPDEDTIIPFDRSYGGTIEPAVVSGKGYVSMKDAMRTFPRAAWIRLYLLQAKVFAIALAVLMVFMIVLIPQIYLLTPAKGGQ